MVGGFLDSVGGLSAGLDLDAELSETACQQLNCGCVTAKQQGAQGHDRASIWPDSKARKLPKALTGRTMADGTGCGLQTDSKPLPPRTRRKAARVPRIHLSRCDCVGILSSVLVSRRRNPSALTALSATIAGS